MPEWKEKSDHPLARKSRSPFEAETMNAEKSYQGHLRNMFARGQEHPTENPEYLIDDYEKERGLSLKKRRGMEPQWAGEAGQKHALERMSEEDLAYLAWEMDTLGVPHPEISRRLGIRERDLEAYLMKADEALLGARGHMD